MAKTPTPKSGFSASVKRMADGALALLDLPPGLDETIKSVNSVLQVQFPAKMDDGRYQVFQGWRAVHSLVDTFGESVVVPSAVGRRHSF